MYARNVEVGSVLGVEEDGTVVFVVGVENGTCAGFKLVPPALTDVVSIGSGMFNAAFGCLDSPLPLNDTRAVDLDIISSPLPEHDGLLKRVIPGIFLPVFNIICELALVSPAQGSHSARNLL